MKTAARRNGQPFLRVAGVNLRDKERDKNGKHGLLLDFISFNHSGAGMRLGVSQGEECYLRWSFGGIQVLRHGSNRGEGVGYGHHIIYSG